MNKVNQNTFSGEGSSFEQKEELHQEEAKHFVDPPVTVTISRLVKPGCEKEFEQLVFEVSQHANAFLGHLGTDLFRPSGSTKEYRIIYKFDCMSHFYAWKNSSIRADYYKKIEPLLSKPPEMSVLTGLETWFDLPNHQGALVPPPRYKMATVSWIAIYPLVILILECLTPILNPLPIPIKAAIITLIAIPTMTYILMPRMTQLFSKWLYPVISAEVKSSD